jgi:hypothetical protein
MKNLFTLHTVALLLFATSHLAGATATAPAKISVPAGFKVELIYTVPKTGIRGVRFALWFGSFVLL